MPAAHLRGLADYFELTPRTKRWTQADLNGWWRFYIPNLIPHAALLLWR